eukprot:365325-Chlamydomonas_euryale.AAC.22
MLACILLKLPCARKFNRKLFHGFQKERFQVVNRSIACALGLAGSQHFWISNRKTIVNIEDVRSLSLPGHADMHHVRVRITGSGPNLAPYARYLGLMTAEDASKNPNLHRRLAAAGEAFKDLLPALRRVGSMRTRAMLYGVFVVPSLLYAVPETSGLTHHQLQPLISAHNAYLRQVTGMGGRLDGTLYPTAHM